MPVVVRCPTCGGEAAVPDQLHGQAVLCPRCQMRFTAPDAPPPIPTKGPLLPTPPVAPPPNDSKSCIECKAPIRRAAVVCPSCGVPQPGSQTIPYQPPGSPVAAAPLLAAPAVTSPPSNRVLAGIVGILVGCLGVHKFVLGYNMEGLIMLGCTLIGSLCFGIGPLAMFGIGVAEGIIYLSKSDSEFHETYVAHRRGWF